MRLFRKKPRCPYCDFELDKKPTRKKKCPNCSEYIIVRQGELYTEEQAEIMYQVGILEQYGASQKMFEDARKELSEHFGFQASGRDTLWKMMNSLISQQERSIDKELLYVHMGYFIEEEGKDPAPLIEQAMKLMEERVRKEVRGMAKFSVQTNNDELVCDSCKNASESSISKEEFLEKMPIATGCLSKYGCRCRIALELDDSWLE
jgi:predicted RNA-binding Zn-ribbon protein involved in translation (DUF1610 family)